MTRQTSYRVAGASLVVEAQDAWSAGAIDALFAGWYLAEDDRDAHEPSPPAIVMRGAAPPAPIPSGLPAFAIAGGGTCYTDGGASYIDLDGSVVAIGLPGRATVEISAGGRPAIESEALTRVVSYALAAALRRRRLFQLHSSALVHPGTGRGVLIAGPSGSGKSTLAVHLASAGWPFLTDDVLLLGREADAVRAWPLRRCFAITAETFAASGFLRARTSLERMDTQADDKRQFLPHEVFAAFQDCSTPGTLFFPGLTGEAVSRVTRLSAGETMARLIRMSPWSAYDRSTAADHLAVLSALAGQCTGFALLAGRDLMDAERAVRLIGDWTDHG